MDYSTFTLIKGDIPHEYFNYWLPRTDEPEKLELSLIDEKFSQRGLVPSVYLTDKQQQIGFVEHLIRHGYGFDSEECWLGYDSTRFNSKTITCSIVEVDANNWNMFAIPALRNFESFSSQPQYVQACFDTQSGSRMHQGVKSKFYAILEQDQPVASAGMFYSQMDNFAYLHCGSTLESARGKGYQTSLIMKRINVAREANINRIYTITERGSQSWMNFIKVGLNEIQQPVLLKKKL